ncbi:hypothetical protein PLESTB_001059000 [Pleodorina starrii]|uniref:Uncharacterized protein n=1 Tax=Pleodorina starrii TaxID=330485 RepID=A0A9W6BPY4_9CHLO|nr:hypothetical protein PLESTB_001059000 [Pleodorina starrii]
MERRADLLVTADTRGHVYVFHIRQNRFSCLDKVGSAGTAAIVQGPRSIFVAFADSSIRCYDASKGTVVGVLREHRSPVRHMELNRELNELMSTSVDGVLVWDLKKLRRKRVLGSGPYGALQASYTPDGQAVVTHFKDGSFYVWSVGNFALLRSFTLPVAPALRPAQASFCLSPDGQLLVACGPSLPVLLVYSVIGGALRYGVGLPAAPSQLDVGVDAAAAAAAGAAAAAAAAAEAAAGAVALPPPGMEPRSAAAAALASKLPMAVGVQQAVFLPDSATVAAMLTDGSVAFVDVLAATFVGAVPYSFPERPDGSFSMDARAQHMALTANGKVFLYDLAGRATSVQPPRPLPRLPPTQLDDLAAAVAMEHLRRERQREAEQEQRAEEAAERRQEHPYATSAGDTGAHASDTQQPQDNRAAGPGPAPAADGRAARLAGGAVPGQQPGGERVAVARQQARVAGGR